VKRSNDERDGLSSSTSCVAASAAPTTSPFSSSASVASAATSSTLSNIASAGALATDRLGLQLYSQSCYAALESAGIRDLILGLHAELLELPADMAHLFEFTQQVHMLLLMFSEDLSHSDFISFLTGGRPLEQLEKDYVWSTSPLALWTRYETRPAFHVYPLSDDSSLSFFSSHPSIHFLQEAHAELKVEWISERSHQGNGGGQGGRRWPQMMLEAVRRSYPKAIDVQGNRSADGAGATSAETSAATPDHPMNNDSTNSADSSFSNMLSSFNLLSMANTLSAEAPLQRPSSASSAVAARFHAPFCPAIASAQQYHKRPRTESPGGATEGASFGANGVVLDPTVVCVCSSSAPLVFRIGVNAAFTRLCGWRSCDLTAAFANEGQLSKRHMHPASIWLRMRQDQTAGWRTCIEFVGRTAVVEAQVRMGAVPRETFDRVPLPAESPPFEVQIRAKIGETLPGTFVGWSKVHHPSATNPFAGVTKVIMPKEA
jgi:hypothetical protein